MNWFRQIIDRIVFRKVIKARREISNIARDELGRWLTTKDGHMILKTDDPKVIAEAIARNKKRDEQLKKNLQQKPTCKCEGYLCLCSESNLPQSVVKEIKKKTEEKPVAKKKPAPKKK